MNYFINLKSKIFLILRTGSNLQQKKIVTVIDLRVSIMNSQIWR
jgi:hypothetical protein